VSYPAHRQNDRTNDRITPPCSLGGGTSS